ncbi:MAG: hypothetical protein ACP5U1_05460 [Desulfomonilaceae bacterium]
MDRFEYEITRHPSETFTKVVYFCTDKGDCGIDEIPSEEPQALVEALNERGDQGWELVQLMFGPRGVMACWKRKIADIIEP